MVQPLTRVSDCSPNHARQVPLEASMHLLLIKKKIFFLAVDMHVSLCEFMHMCTGVCVSLCKFMIVCTGAYVNLCICSSGQKHCISLELELQVVVSSPVQG